jgi:hypothetical protein
VAKGYCDNGNFCGKRTISTKVKLVAPGHCHNGKIFVARGYCNNANILWQKDYFNKVNICGAKELSQRTSFLWREGYCDNTNILRREDYFNKSEIHRTKLSQQDDCLLRQVITTIYCFVATN